MKKRTRRIAAAAVAATAALSLLLPSAVSAGCYNPADGCKTKTTVKKALAPVVHDGVISPGEYEEIQLASRDGYDEAGTCDLLFGYLTTQCLDYAVEAAKDVHFYISWDEQNGLNLAVVGKTIETPKNENTKADWPEDGHSSDHGTFPTDGFITQLGAMFRIRTNNGTDEEPDFADLIDRGIAKSTATGELLYGWYWEHGYDNYLQTNRQVEGQDYNCSINMDTHECVFEISYPFAAALKPDDYSGSTPNEGAVVYFDMSFVGGGVGKGVEGAENTTYAVSLGDSGYFGDSSVGHSMPATGIFSLESVGGSGTTDPGTTDPGTTGGTPGTTDPGTTGGTPGTTEPGTTGGTPGTTEPGTTGGTPGTTTPGTTGGTPGTTDPGTTGGNPGTTTPGATGGTPGTTTPGTTGGTPGTTTTPGNNTTPTTPGNNTGTNTNKNPQTGDAMMVLALVSALSAGGAMISKKRR